jgi:hypothetical protein
MNKNRLAEIYAIKYKVAASPADIEIPLRKKLSMLWNYPNKLFNVLKACSDSDPSKGKEPHDNKAYAGYKFCKEILGIIDNLKENAGTVSLGEMRDKLLRLVKLIEAQKDQKFTPKGNPSVKGEESVVQFPHVSELIYQLVPISKKHDMKLRNELLAKARTGLSRIHSFSMDLLKDLQELEVMVPEKFTYSGKEDINQDLPDRFSPQRGMLSNNDIVDFIRQYGPTYGINSRDDWEIVFGNNPQLKEEMTSVINALNRGQYAANDVMVRDEISKKLREHQENQLATTPHFEGPK